MKELFELFLTFAKIGSFTFGGGYAMLSLIEDACVQKKAWITHDDMLNLTVVAESTPGPIAVNCATFVGYKRRGVFGAAVATFGMILPSFAIILLISAFFDRFLAIRWVAGAFQGVKAAVGILIVNAALTLFRKMPKTAPGIMILAAAFAAMLAIDIFALRVSTIVLLLVSGALSFTVFAVKRAVKGGGEK
ncbi:MAG: chromate transporter [Clostridia bacterium]|nr:chromate transporter [Clostridia bacterium]